MERERGREKSARARVRFSFPFSVKVEDDGRWRESDANCRRGERHHIICQIRAARGDFELELVKVGVETAWVKLAKSFDTC